MNKIKSSFFHIFLFLLPKNWVSFAMGQLVSMRIAPPVARFVNKKFAEHFKINLLEAERPIEEYPCLQDFFIRRLKPETRPLPSEDSVIISPCDGTLSVVGPIVDGTLIQAKGRNFSLDRFLGDKALASRFLDGSYATIYLSPKDYHRFHVPMSGEIIKTIYIPGALWPVNPWAVKTIDGLFCQNERVISIIEESKTKRLLAHVAVGATMVGKIDMLYGNLDALKKQRTVGARHVDEHRFPVKMGDELGKFMFGSTIVMIFEKNLVSHFVKHAPESVKMGEILGNLPK